MTELLHKRLSEAEARVGELETQLARMASDANQMDLRLAMVQQESIRLSEYAANRDEELDALRPLLDNTACYQALIECKAERELDRLHRRATTAEARIEAALAVVDEHSEGEFSGACDICEWLDKVATALAAVPPETPKETQ